MDSTSKADASCSGCIFFSSGRGACQRYPPVPVAVDDGYGDATEKESVWPSVEEDDWCGEYVSTTVQVQESGVADGEKDSKDS